MKLRMALSVAFFVLPITGAMADPTPAPPYTGGDRVVWDTWYTVTVKGAGAAKVPVAYYNDRLELKKGKLFYKNRVWKKEEGFLNEEQLGALSENSDHLAPVMYNFHANYRSVETTIDGSTSGKVLTLMIHKADQQVGPLKKILPQKAFFSVFFPVWLGYRLKTLKPGASALSFQTFLEDNADAAFAPVSGTVRLEKPDDIANRLGAQKLAVNYGNIKTFWWVESSGVPLRIEAPEQGRVVERATQAVAEKFLEGP